MKTVLVTGAAGFVGRAVVSALGRGEWRVLALPGRTTNPLGGAPPASDPAAIWGPAGDLSDAGAETTVAWAIEKGPPEAVVHLAGFAAVGRAFRDPNRAFRANVLSTTGLIEAFLSHPSGLRPRLLLASSSAVYGRVPADRPLIAETEPVAPVSPYGLSKAMAEEALGYAGRLGFPAIVARFFNMCGPGQAEGFVLSDFARAFRARTPTMKIGRLDVVRDFLDVRDAGEAVAALLDRAPAGAVVNVASGRGVALEEAIDFLVKRTGHRPTLEYDPTRSRPSDVDRAVADVSRLRATGFRPTHTFEETLGEMLS